MNQDRDLTPHERAYLNRRRYRQARSEDGGTLVVGAILLAVIVIGLWSISPWLVLFPIICGVPLLAMAATARFHKGGKES